MAFFYSGRKSIILFTFLLTLLFFITTIIIYKQENPYVFMPNSAEKLKKELRIYLLELNLNLEIPVFGSVLPWDYFNYSNFSIDSEKLEKTPKKIMNDCIPDSFGYTIQQSDSLFDPHATFSDCGKETAETLDYNETHLIKVCQNAFYELGLDPSEERFGRVPYKIHWKTMTEDVKIGNTEYAFIKCGKKRQAMSFLKENYEAKNRAKNISLEISQKLGLKSFKPLSVFLLIFDSLSRFHMFRNFNSTLDYLNENIVTGKLKEKFVLYDFVLNHAHGENTIPNMIPYLFGYNEKYQSLRLKGFDYFNQSHEQKFLEIQKDAI